MGKMYWHVLLLSLVIASSCTSSRKNYDPAARYSPELLREDFTVMRNILEKKHPSLYWYSSKDSIDAAFEHYYRSITDSMTESAFAWRILAPLTRQFRCGHTTAAMSRRYTRWAKGRQLPSFPLYMKVWNDSMVVTGNLNRKDSLFKRGTVITSINGMKNHELIATMFQYLPADGYAENINQVRLSANFPYYHRNIFGLSKTYRVGYLDSAGAEKEAVLPLFQVVKDSLKKKTTPPTPAKKLPRSKRLEEYRSLDIDSSGQFAVMTVNTFTEGMLRTFFRRSFRKLKKQGIRSLVIDIRSNGGGHISLSTLLTRYITDKPFTIADTVYAKARSLRPYSRYIRNRLIYNTAMFFVASKKKDGLYHARYMEKKKFRPKKTHHFDGDTYVLTAGQTFSAAALFSNTVKGQQNVTLVGEETGGGWHGNNGVLIPEIRLPNTRLRLRLPLYRLVQFNHVPKNGTGVLPDVYVGPNYRALVEKRDRKMEVVKELIRMKHP